MSLLKLGVCVHPAYTDGQYANGAKTLAALKMLGVSSVRCAAPNPFGNTEGQNNLAILAQGGIDFCFTCETLADVANLAAFAGKHPGSVRYVEGPNEVDNGLSKTPAKAQAARSAAVALMVQIYAAVKASAVLKAVPVVNFTSQTGTVGKSDRSNAHIYPSGANPPEAWIKQAWAAHVAATPKEPLVVTEFGYPTLGAVTNADQAKWVAQGYQDLVSLGAEFVYAYQLVDGYPDATDTNYQNHFGLFNLDWTPKPAAAAIAALLKA